MATQITVLFDNEAEHDGLESGWGLSYHISHDGVQLLFDAGWDGDQVLHNADRLGIDLRATSALVVSHMHWDHAGGIPRLLRHLPPLPVYLPAGGGRHQREEIARRAQTIEVSSPQDIVPGVISTGPLGEDPPEQSLLIEAPEGIALVTGCAHPGVPQLLERAEALGPVCALIGGLHGFADLAALEPISLLGPGHCTQRKMEIRQTFPAQTVACGAGATIML